MLPLGDPVKDPVDQEMAVIPEMPAMLLFLLTKILVFRQHCKPNKPCLIKPHKQKASMSLHQLPVSHHRISQNYSFLLKEAWLVVILPSSLLFAGRGLELTSAFCVPFEIIFSMNVPCTQVKSQ
jgi:hypothetical protein